MACKREARKGAGALVSLCSVTTLDGTRTSWRGASREDGKIAKERD